MFNLLGVSNFVGIKYVVSGNMVLIVSVTVIISVFIAFLLGRLVADHKWTKASRTGHKVLKNWGSSIERCYEVKQLDPDEVRMWIEEVQYNMRGI